MASKAEYKPSYKELNLEETSTWTVAVVCCILLLISIFIEQSINKIGSLLKKKHKTELFEAFEKVKAELMLLGFISLLLTVGQDTISGICIPKHVALYMRPCSDGRYNRITGMKLNETELQKYKQEKGQRLLIELAESYIPRRSLATKGYDKCANKGQRAFVSAYGIHQLHVFIFVLAVVHVVYCILTYALGKTKMRTWKSWEEETKTKEYEHTNDPERFRFARDTTFGKRHLNFWSKTSVTLWIVCFFRQFSVTKVDYLALRHGFVMKHVAPGTNSRYDFRKYVQRTLEKDFKTVVEISPVIWTAAVLCLLTNSNGLRASLWLPFIPLAILLIVGTKLQVIITKMGIRFADKGDVVRGAPVVQPGDDLFWFGKPKLILYLVHLVLFTNAFQFAFFLWSTYEFKLKNCFHESTVDVSIRIGVGVIVQILCSYVTLPLYALVTQMGSKLKPTVFTDGVVTALDKWHHTAKDHTKHGSHSHSEQNGSFTPTHGSSPVHLLHKSNSRSDESSSNSRAPRYSGHDEHQFWDPESQHQKADASTHHTRGHETSEKKLGSASMEVE